MKRSCKRRVIVRLVLLGEAICLVVLLLMTPLAFFLGQRQPLPSETPPPGEPAREIEKVPLSRKLKISVGSIRRKDERLELSYTLEWVERRDDEPPFIFLHPWTYMDVVFWDAGGKEVGRVSTEEIWLRPDFAYLAKCRSQTGVVELSPPRGARFVAIGFPTTMSKKHRVPE
jgi:hypothetical protein